MGVRTGLLRRRWERVSRAEKLKGRTVLRMNLSGSQHKGYPLARDAMGGRRWLAEAGGGGDGGGGENGSFERW